MLTDGLAVVKNTNEKVHNGKSAVIIYCFWYLFCFYWGFNKLFYKHVMGIWLRANVRFEKNGIKNDIFYIKLVIFWQLESKVKESVNKDGGDTDCIGQGDNELATLESEKCKKLLNVSKKN